MPKKKVQTKPIACAFRDQGCDKVNTVMDDLATTKQELKTQGEAIKRIEDRCENMDNNIDKIADKLMGNSREGVCDRLTRIEGKAKFNNWFSLLIISGMVMALIAAIISHLSDKGV